MASSCAAPVGGRGFEPRFMLALFIVARLVSSLITSEAEADRGIPADAGDVTSIGESLPVSVMKHIQ